MFNVIIYLIQFVFIYYCIIIIKNSILLNIIKTFLKLNTYNCKFLPMMGETLPVKPWKIKREKSNSMVMG